MRHRRSTAALLAAGTLAAALAATAPAASQPPGPPPGTPGAEVLDRARRGDDALRALGPDLPAVAAANDRTPAAFAAALRADRDLWVDPTGRLVFVDEGMRVDSAPPLGVDGAAPDGPFPYEETFRLHSRPAAQRTIYLDVDGHLVSGTAWNQSYMAGGADYVATGYDTNGNPAEFTEAERDVIQSLWQRVAEDYAPFDVDVTTEDPGFEAIHRSDVNDQVYGTRLVVTNTTIGYSTESGSASGPCNCGGIAYVGVFDTTGSSHSYYQPAFVYQRGVGSGAKNLAEAASHEVGHNLGLGHDGTTSGCGTGGTSPCGYYTGHGSWAPIMGVGYYEPITQWSRGEYSRANNTEDDLTVMAANGAPRRGDEHGGTTATATSLGAGAALTGSGVVHDRTDVDAFVFSAGAGPATITVTPAPTSPDLDARLELLDAGGAVIASADPPSGAASGDVATGLGATISTTLAAGVYTLRVDGVGAGSPLTDGYSDYGSLGSYTVAGTVPTGTDPPPQPPPPPPTPTMRVTSVRLTLTQVKRNWQATATVTVADAGGSPVGSATVTGDFARNGTVFSAGRTGTTDPTGTAKITSGITKASSGTEIRYCVTGVTAAGYQYDPTTSTTCATARVP